MKWTFIVQQKMKVILLLTIVMSLIVLTNLLEKRNISKMKESFASIYADRLIPATDIFYLTENLFNKRLAMEQYFYKETNMSLSQLKERLGSSNENIEGLLLDFEKTYLTAQEEKYLMAFRDHTVVYNQQEADIFATLSAGRKEEARILFEENIMGELKTSLMLLEELTKIQSSVGETLTQSSNTIALTSNAISTLQIIVAITIGLMVQGLIFASKATRPHQPFLNLN